jgi:hypothetical protein
MLTTAVLAAVLLVGLLQVAMAAPTQGPTDPTAREDIASDWLRKLGDADHAALQEPPHVPPMAVPDALAVVLWDNGPLVNSPGTGIDGADESVLQNTSLGMITLGFGHQVSADNRIADDFEIADAAGWTVSAITFFAYQTGSTTTSTMDAVNLRIWDGPPGDPGSSVVWGDTSTNILGATGWTNIYRVTEDTTGTSDDRPIMYNTAVVNGFLPQGTYWLDWQTGGTLSSGPWAPPITINGQATTGNGLQSTDGGMSWGPAEDDGSVTQQGFPFVIEGDVGPVAISSISLDKTVSTVVGSCPGSDSVTVAPGSEVSYCYEVTNTGTVTLTLHDLVDSELGTLALGLPYTLTPGSSTGAGTGGVTINTTTVNTATWTAYNPGPTDVALATDTAVVIVGEPASLVCNGSPVGFDTGIPLDWTVVNNAAGNPVEWSNIAGCGESGNYTGGTGDAACASSDLQGGGSGLYDTELWTPPFSLEGVGSPMLTFLANYQNFAAVDFLDVDVSTDGGATWTNLLSWNEDHGAFRDTPGEEATIDLSAYVGQPNVIVRWHYYDPGGPATSQDWYAQVDDVALDCTIGPGIAIAKTAGSDPGVCATEDTFVVAPGDPAYYCYEVRNTGTVTLSVHDLDDSELGTIFSGLAYDLGPGDSVNTVAAGLTISDTIDFTTVNTATWAAYNPGPTDLVTDTASTLVVVSADELSCNGPPVEFEFGIPSTFVTAAQGPVYWTTTDDPDGCDNPQQTGSFGVAACADADTLNPSPSVPYTAQLWSNSFDLSTFVSATLDLRWRHRQLNDSVFTIDVSTDGGGTWTNLVTNTDGNPSGVSGDPASLDLSPFAGHANVIVRFVFSGDGWDWYAQVDQLELSCGGIQPLPDISVDPLSMNVLLSQGQSTMRPLEISNVGLGLLTWEIQEDGTHSSPDAAILAGAAPDCSMPSDIAWLSVDPISGTTLGGMTTPVEVTFDAGALSPGLYTGNLCITSNDPDPGPGNGTDLVVVPLTLTVSSPPGARIGGHVFEDLNRNGVYEPWLGELGIGGVTVTRSGGFSTISNNVNGWYGFYIPSHALPGTVTVTETQPPNHISTTPNSYSLAVQDGDHRMNLNFGEVPVSPSIELLKTVGTDPSVCAATDEIDVVAGTEVYYCYTVANTGDVTLDLHDLADSELGTILDGFSFALTPGASVSTVAAGLTLSATIDSTTVNTATWTAYLDPYVVASDTATATVNVVEPAIDLVKTVGTDPAVCAMTDEIDVFAGTEVYYCYTVTNTGDTTLNLHDLEDSELGIILDDFSFALAPGASVDTVAAGLTLSATINASTVNTATWTAFNDAIVTATATDSAMVNVVSRLLYLPLVHRNQ